MRTVQKGAVLICDDHKGATYVAASALTLGLLLGSFTVARASESTPAVAPAAAAAAAASPVPDASSAPVVMVSVTFVNDDLESTFQTTAKTVADLLAEHGIAPADDDYLSSPLDQPLADGERLVYRPAVPVVIEVGQHRSTLRTSAATISDLLADAHVKVARGDEVSPDLASRPLAHEIVRVSRVTTWTKRFVETIAQRVTHEVDGSLLKGTTKILSAGRPGSRLIVVRYTRRDGGEPASAIVSTRVLREPEATLVAVGSAAPPVLAPETPVASFAAVAQQGLASAVRLAGSALHMIATAYTAGCYGCSGITALGMHAGQGVVAVDPHVIPLGTRLWIPGYGRAIAGDTGGAINGNRIDLGMNSNGDALRFGRRDVTVYVIK